MNPFFIILIVLVTVILWFLLSSAFVPLGKIIYRIWKNAVNKINKEDERTDDK